MLAEQIHHAARTAGARARNTKAVPKPLYGDAIFEGTDYPRTWQDFVGQKGAVMRLRAACFSARKEQRRLDHVLLASGIAGVGKTSLARLVAADLGTGFIEVSGPMKVDDARPILQGMADGDVLFYDEIHQAVAGGAAKAEWLLHLLQDGHLVTKSGVEVLPKITVIAATTDSQKLPVTILGRFPVKPVIEPYTLDEAAEICRTMARRMGYGDKIPDYHDVKPLAAACNGNPRDMRALLIALRDSYYGSGSSTYDLQQALDWVGVTSDGLTRLCQDYLLVLLTMFEGQAGEKSIQSAMGEPGPLRHTEQLLIQKGYIQIMPNGRAMTEQGVERTTHLLTERGLL